jgi:hypothetical protein
MKKSRRARRDSSYATSPREGQKDRSADWSIAGIRAAELSPGGPWRGFSGFSIFESTNQCPPSCQETNLTPAGPSGFVPYPAQLIAKFETPVNVRVSAMSWLQLVLVPVPPANVTSPAGK